MCDVRYPIRVNEPKVIGNRKEEESMETSDSPIYYPVSDKIASDLEFFYSYMTGLAALKNHRLLFFFHCLFTGNED